MLDSSTRTPLSEEQLKFFADLQAESTRRALSRWAIGATTGFAILFLGTLAVYWNGQNFSKHERGQIVTAGRSVAISACNARFQDRKEIRAIIIAVRENAVQDGREGRRSAEEVAQRITFYNDRLEKLPLPDCRKADDALETVTDDKDFTATMPVARYPGDGKG